MAPWAKLSLCSGTDGPTSNIAAFFDYILKPIASQQSTFAKGTTDIIKIEANTFPPDIFTATIDVTAMSCNSIQNEAIEIECDA